VSETLDRVVHIYTLSCPESGAVRYIGKTVNLRTRYARHITDPHTPQLREWMEELEARNSLPRITVIDTIRTGKAERAEMRHIKTHLADGCKLLNRYIGERRRRTDCVFVGFFAPVELKRALQAAAERNGRSLTEEIVRRLEDSLKQEEG
jgi:hypothetical protein